MILSGDTYSEPWIFPSTRYSPPGPWKTVGGGAVAAPPQEIAMTVAKSVQNYLASGMIHPATIQWETMRL